MSVGKLRASCILIRQGIHGELRDAVEHLGRNKAGEVAAERHRDGGTRRLKPVDVQAVEIAYEEGREDGITELFQLLANAEDDSGLCALDELINDLESEIENQKEMSKDA